jgi:hypothetical protein
VQPGPYGPNIAVRVEFMAHHVPSQAGKVTHALFVTLVVPLPLINTVARSAMLVDARMAQVSCGGITINTTVLSST